jgi:hypothetical protein
LLVGFDEESGRVLIEIKQDENKKLSPRDMRQLGMWLVEQGANVGRAYTNTDFRDKFPPSKKD